jgi:hypothetical protein
MKIKINKLDRLCSEIVRLRAKGVCEIGGEYNQNLMACHGFGRANKKVRWDLDNIVAGCFAHHVQIDSDHEKKRNLFIKRLGQKSYENLNRRANWGSLNKPDLKAIEFYLKAELLKYQ